MKLTANQLIGIVILASVFFVGLVMTSAEIPREATIIVTGKSVSIFFGKSYFITDYNGNQYYTKREIYEKIEIGASYRIIEKGVLPRIVQAEYIKTLEVFS